MSGTPQTSIGWKYGLSSFSLLTTIQFSVMMVIARLSIRIEFNGSYEHPLTKSQALAKSWLSQSKNNKDGRHQECNKRDNDYIPARLLDIRHAQRTSRLRIVCSQLTPEMFAEDREWMTLSHCWGEWGAKNNPMLLKANVRERQEVGLDIADLPKTFQDAIEISGWYGSAWQLTSWTSCSH